MRKGREEELLMSDGLYTTEMTRDLEEALLEDEGESYGQALDERPHGPFAYRLS